LLLEFSSPTKTTNNNHDDESGSSGDGNDKCNEDIIEMWRNHLDNLRELVQDETNCKWAYLGIVQVIDWILSVTTRNDHDDVQSDSGGGVEESRQLREEKRAILKKLVVIDPNRKERYKQMIEL